MTANDSHALWGYPHSFWTGKVRSYLIKKGVPYREKLPSDPEFQARILPAVRLLVVPILATPDGRILQDTTDIIEHLEAERPTPPMVPDTQLQKAVAWLLCAFGSAGLPAPGMHYRWSYRAEQENFLCAEFGRLLHRRSGSRRALRLGPQDDAVLQQLPAVPGRHAADDPGHRDRLR